MTTINWSFSTVVDTAQLLFNNNPVLQTGQVGIEVDSLLFKIGDGTTAWNDLTYAVLNNQQSVWMGASADPENLLVRSVNDGGMLLNKLLFMASAEVNDTLLSETTPVIDALDASAPMKAAMYRVIVIVRGILEAMGVEYATVKTNTFAGTTIDSRLDSLESGLQVAQGVIVDTATASDKTWSSTKIDAEVASRISAAVAALVDTAPEALNTIYELASAFTQNQGLVTSITEDLGSMVRFTVAQTLTLGQQLQARENIGAASALLLGDYPAIEDKTLLAHYEEALGQIPPSGTPSLYDLDSRLVAMERRTGNARCSMFKSGYDMATGQYLVIEWKRSDTTLAMRSTMSAPDAGGTGLFATRTEQYYDNDGTTLAQTVVYSLTYDNHRNVVSEQIVSVI